MKQARWRRMVEPYSYVPVCPPQGRPVIVSEIAVKLLARQHAGFVRLVKYHRATVPVAGQEKDPRVIAYQLACNDILAALAKQGGKK